MMHFAKGLVRRLPHVQRLLHERAHLRNECHQLRLQQLHDRFIAARLANEQHALQAEIARLQGEGQGLRSEHVRLRADLATIAGARNQAQHEGALAQQCQSVPPGHPSSAIPSIAELKTKAATIWGSCPRELAGVDLNTAGQLAVLHAFENFYAEAPDFPAQQPSAWRYYHDNGYFPCGDAHTLYCMLRYLRPRRVIEVGSGYSSCVTLDVNERFFANQIVCTFIEPYPQRLRSLLRPDDRIDLIETPLQDVNLNVFQRLGPRDILFIDSTHAAKCGSDVNYILFEILPSLQSGVFIHIHDIHYPFEYPDVWVFRGMHWNENYLLRAFLQYNRAFRIQFWYRYLLDVHHATGTSPVPLCLRSGGSCFWMEKV